MSGRFDLHAEPSGPIAASPEAMRAAVAVLTTGSPGIKTDGDPTTIESVFPAADRRLTA